MNIQDLINEYKKINVKINGKRIEHAGYFAFDGCHKLYIINSFDDMQSAWNAGFSVIQIKSLKQYYNTACPLRFINRWDLKETYAPQGKRATIEIDGGRAI